MAGHKIEDAPAKYKSKVWQFFGFEKTVDNSVKSVNKAKTVRKVCQSDISYATGTTTNRVRILLNCFHFYSLMLQ